MNAWTYLFLGIVFEVIGTTCLKLSNGFTNLIYAALCLGFFSAGLYFLSLSVRSLDLAIVYAIWSGVGIALISIIGIFLFHETMSLTEMLFVALIFVGVLGLHWHGQATA